MLSLLCLLCLMRLLAVPWLPLELPLWVQRAHDAALLLRAAADSSQGTGLMFSSSCSCPTKTKHSALLLTVLQIRASFSPGGDYITCGSDDGWVSA